MLIRDGEETRLGAKTTLERRAGRRRSATARAAAAATGRRAERDPERVRARRARGQGQRRARARVYGEVASSTGDGGAAVIDPITFEVIRNALVAATDEMVLALKRSAYSTNIKTRSDFSCAFFDAELRSVAQGVRAARAPRLDGRAGAEGGARATAPENLGPGDVIVTNDPHPSGVHLNDVSLISPVHCDGELLGYVANLAHHVDVGGGAPGVDRRLPRGVPGGRDHPARQARRGRQDRRRRLPARPRADPLEARDRRRLPRADRRERDRRAARPGARRRATASRRSVATMEELLDYTERRTRAELAALAARRLRGRGLGRQRRLHRRAGAPEGADRDRARRRPLRHRRAPTRSGARRSTRPTR